MSDLEDGSEAVKRLNLLEGKYSKVESILGQILGHLKSTQNPAPPTTAPTAPPGPSPPVQPATVASAASTSAPSTSPWMSVPGPSTGSSPQSFPPNMSYPGIPVGLGGPPLQYNPYAFFPGAGYFPYPGVLQLPLQRRQLHLGCQSPVPLLARLRRVFP
ncbi:splicing factor 3B subunit 4-like [Diaphorina citri]|uniref:Splicing factor 3B subunit 4-like n=1 Tax=Diaphorina citri TaxID=121845 RepID=A0A3Q0JGX2_DIACI|nr:splicing factor 3B subunit 4-like [Diaphorina citri]